MKKFVIYILILLPFISGAQIPLTLTNAIDTALKNNFDIQIAKNNTEIGRISNTYGNAGGLPSINATGSDNNSLINLNQKLSSGVNTSKSNVNNSSMNAGLTASMILFNGFQITATKEKLNWLQKQSITQLNLQIQNTIAGVMASYYDILRQQSYLNIIKSSIDVSAKKLEIVKNRYNVGMANEADLLQAQIDLSAAEQDLNGQQLIIDQAKTSLLQVMSVKHFYPITVHDTIVIDKTIPRDTVINFLEKNPQYLVAVQQIRINEQIMKQQKALRYPSIRFNTGYNYTYSSSSAGFNLSTKNYGPSIGATIQIPIFNGTIYKTQQEVALFNVKNSELEKESVLIGLRADAVKTYDSFESTLQQIVSQQVSYQNAVKLVNIVVQRFRLNQATILDVKAAQASFEGAGNTLVNLQYSAKIAEIELKRLLSRLENW
jgi:outer membrane protein